MTPDLCTLGKAVGGGFPLSVFGGRRDVMDRLMPIGDCQHSGTYNGHVVAVAAGLAAVTAYREPGFYEHIHAVGRATVRRPQRDLRPARRRRPRAGAGGALRRLFRRRRAGPQTTATPCGTSARRCCASSRRRSGNGVYFHDYGGAACHHGFCAAMTLADVDETLRRLDGAVRDVRTNRSVLRMASAI